MTPKQEQLFPDIDFKPTRSSVNDAVGGTAVRRLIELPGKRPGLVNNPFDLPSTPRQAKDGRTDEEFAQAREEFKANRAVYAPSTLPKQEDAAPAVTQAPRVAIGSRAIPWEQRHIRTLESTPTLPEQQLHSNLEAQQSE